MHMKVISASGILLLFSSYYCCGETVLLTGGAGFIGSHTAKALLQRNYRVIVVDNLNDYYSPSLKHAQLTSAQAYDITKTNFVFYHTDILDKETLAAIWEKEKPLLVCHLAGYASVVWSINNPELYLKTNVLGMMNLLELAKKYGVKNFVFASSSSVYGKNTQVPFCESEAADKPVSPYAMSKRSAELLAYTYHDLYKIPCTGLRFFNVYGPNGRPDMAPFMFLHKIYHNEPITLFGDSAIRMRDFTYIDDIVDGIIKALENPHDFEIFNLGKGEPVTLQKFIETIEHIVNKKAIIIEKQVPAGEVDITYADINKAKRLLNYHPLISLEEGIRRMFAWYLEEEIKQTWDYVAVKF